MSSDYSSHVAADSMPQSDHVPGHSAQPVVVPPFAKLVIMVGALVIFTPPWLNLLVQLGSAQSWYALRLLALGGSAGVVTLLVLIFKLSSGLLKTAGRT